MATSSVIDAAPVSGFHRKLTLYSAGGPFIDGYVLSIIGVALVGATPALGLSSTEAGLVGAVVLVGIFVGGLVFGYVTDLVGRQTMYVVDLLVFIVASILCFFVTDAWQLIALRFIIGMAVGADYPIATSLLAEFLPVKGRGFLLSGLTFAWALGALIAYLVGWAMLGLGDEAWRYMLASAAIPAIATVLARVGTPESPRWLLSKGRIDEAREVLRKVYGPGARVEDVEFEEEPTDFRKVFRAPYLKRTVFAGLYWMLQIVPLYAVLTYGPSIFEGLGFGAGSESFLVSAGIETAFLVGTIPAMILAERMRRRAQSMWSFIVMAVGLLIAALLPGSAPAVIVGFAIYALASGGPFCLQWVYPNEIFPTDVRATAFGIATAISRIGAAAGTFLVPFALDGIGAGATLFVAVGITLLGWVVTYAWAPETKGLSLAESAGEAGTWRRPATSA